MAKRKLCSRLAPLLLLFSIILSGCSTAAPSVEYHNDLVYPDISEATTPYVTLNENQPDFSESDLARGLTSFESYSELDTLDRCGIAFASVGPDLMPTDEEERKSISSVVPSGWHSVSYEQISGGSLYNRCHLIGYQLSGENANEKNLITGTRYLNVTGMLPFENLVADYVVETGNHVLYRVTPVFVGSNLVAYGVQIEAMSVEDQGEGVLFNVYCFNIQPGIEIDYATGESWVSGEPRPESTADSETSATPVPVISSSEVATDEPESEVTESADVTATYILNTSSKKFHLPDCSSVSKISESNKEEYTGSRAELIADGYSPCGSCKP